MEFNDSPMSRNPETLNLSPLAANAARKESNVGLESDDERKAAGSHRLLFRAARLLARAQELHDRKNSRRPGRLRGTLGRVPLAHLKKDEAPASPRSRFIREGATLPASENSSIYVSDPADRRGG